MADDDIADHLDAAVRQGDRQRLLMIEQRLRARRHWDAQEGRDVGEEVDDIAWLLARCRLLEAERDKARGELTQRRQLLTEWMDWWERDEVSPKLMNVLHARTALTLATPDVIEVAARGVSVPETP